MKRVPSDGSCRGGTSEADFRTAATKKAGLLAEKFFLCSHYSENGLAWLWEAVSGRPDAQPSVSKSARPGTPESELAD